MSFGGLVALEDVSVVIPEGRITGLIGPNGAGKSTLFNCVSGLLEPRAGSVWLAGRDVTRLAPERRARLGLARTFQSPETFRSMTVWENLLVATEARRSLTGILADLVNLPSSRRHAAEAGRRASSMLERLDLGRIADRVVGDLPPGEERLVELARALSSRPRLLMLDEPSSGLDPAETAAFGAVLVDLVEEEGMTICLVEHDMSLVMGVCSSIYVLDFGRVIAHGSPAEVRADPAVVTAYLGAEGS